MNLAAQLQERVTGHQAPSISNVVAVLPDRVVPDATIVVRNGVIEDVVDGTRRIAGAVDGQGALCLPGLVDAHSDAFEKEVVPRATVRLPEDFALRLIEGRLAAAGITTVFHGVAFDEKPQAGRSIEFAHRLYDAIVDRRTQPGVPVDHRVLHRVEARVDGGWKAARARLRDIDGGPRPLVSLEDHSLIQGQLWDRSKFPTPFGTNAAAPEDELAARIADAEAALPVRRQTLAAIREAVATDQLVLLGHDLETSAAVTEAHEQWGASVAEFPVTIEAAAEARRRGMLVVAGGPNAMRGVSHLGNASAADLVASRCCDVLASDYLPASLLAGVFRLAEDGTCDLPTAVGLVTLGPATMAGLDDRGALLPGRRADLVLVHLDGRWPRVVGCWRSST